jgi:pyridoxal phosphate enzyme (YggS family)
MGINKNNYKSIIKELESGVQLISVSKTQPAAVIRELYDLGQKDFGENYVQELTEKHELLPKDIRWHFIGHLQSNKVKFIAPFVELIHSVDSVKLLEEINKQAKKINRIINCLLQVHIASEETKFGLNEEELSTLIERVNTNKDQFKNVKVCGLMGMASFTDDIEKVRNEFKYLKSLFNKYSQSSTINYQLSTLSMGMSADYKIAVEEGSNMVRIGSLVFGERNYQTK